MTTLTATDTDLEALGTAALRSRNLPLFDAAASERYGRPNGDTTVQNHAVVTEVLQAFAFRCPLCNRMRRAFGAAQLALFQRREYCSACWTWSTERGREIPPWGHAEARLKYLDAALGDGPKDLTGGIARKALQFPADAPQRQRLRDAYRRCEALRHVLRARLEAARDGERVSELQGRAIG